MSKVAKNSSNKIEPKLDFSSKQYNHIATGTTLQSIQLLKLAMEGHPEFYSRENKAKLSFGRELISCNFDDEDKIAAAIFRYSVSAKNGRQKAFVCQADYAVVYKMPGDAERDASLAFCRNVGPFACYPYFRAAVSQMAWSSGIDLPPLPSIAAMPIVPKEKQPE